MDSKFGPRSLFLLWIATCLVMLCGCSTTTRAPRGSSEDVVREIAEQHARALKIVWEREARLKDLAWPLLKNGVDLCGEDVRNEFGIVSASLDSIARVDRKTARDQLQIGRQPRIIHVVADSPASRSGLKTHDLLDRSTCCTDRNNYGGRSLASSRWAIRDALALEGFARQG